MTADLSWYAKLTDRDSGPPEGAPPLDPRVDLLARHEELNQVEWKAYIQAILDGTSEAFDALQPDDDQLLLWAAQILDQVSPATRRLVDRGLEACLRSQLEKAQEVEGRRRLNAGLRLAGLVENALAVSFLEEIALSPSYPDALRVGAADALWQSNAEISLHRWQAVELTNEPFLAAAVVGMLRPRHPEEALLALGGLPDPPESFEPFLYPVSLAIRDLAATRKGIEALRAIYADSPGWMRGVLDRLLAEEEEFREKDLLLQITAAEGPRQTGEAGAWARLVRFASDNGYIAYRQVGYGLEPDEDDSFYESLRREFFRPIAEELNRAEMPWKALQYDLNTLVDEMLTGQVPVLEAGYGSRKRRQVADLVRIGWLHSLGLVATAEHVEELRSRWQKTSSQEDEAGIASLEEVVAYVLNERSVRCFAQASSSLADEVLTTLEGMDKEIAARWKEVFRLSENLDVIAETIANDERRIALLDWWSAQQVVRTSERAEESLLRIRYSPRIPVGFFCPRGDARYREVLERAVTVALKPHGTWQPLFRKIMEERCLITLDPDRHDLRAAEDEDQESSEAA